MGVESRPFMFDPIAVGELLDAQASRTDSGSLRPGSRSLLEQVIPEPYTQSRGSTLAACAWGSAACWSRWKACALLVLSPMRRSDRVHDVARQRAASTTDPASA